jgi:hypothetical protein
MNEKAKESVITPAPSRRLTATETAAKREAAKAPPSAEAVLSDAAAKQVTGMILGATDKLTKQMDSILEALKEKTADAYVTHEKPHLEEVRSERLRPTLVHIAPEFMETGYQYRFVHKLKVWKRKAQGYEWVMHKDCPMYEKDANGHVCYADTVLMRIPLDRVRAVEEENAADSSARVGHIKEGFHKAVEAANVAHGSEYVKSFETTKAGKEVS